MIIVKRPFSLGTLQTIPLLISCLVVAGCDKPRQETRGATSDIQHHRLKGRFLSADKHDNTILVDGESIPGFMDAMTMPYTVKDARLLDKLSAGDEITADIVTHEDASWLENVTVVGHTAPQKAPSMLHIPAAGETVPDFRFTNQDGRVISLRSYRGQVLFVTFIYTRCPFPDYCPRMTHEFSEIYSQLREKPTIFSKTHLLSISLDPAHDTPQALRAYGLTIAESKQPNFFRHWEFAVPRAVDLPQLANYFGVTYAQESGAITHSLATAVIAPDGRIFKWYHGSEWQPADLIKDAGDALPSASDHETP